MHSYNFWVFRSKLLGVLVLLADIANASFDKEDYSAISYGLTKTNSDSDVYFEYTFSSQDVFTVGFALDVDDSDIIHLQVHNTTVWGEKVARVDRFQTFFSEWTLNNEGYFLR